MIKNIHDKKAHNMDSNNKVSDIIKKLMSELKIKEAELARQTGLPQTTINRLLGGLTFDPRANTLKPIAKFFGLTIGQILGEEPILHRIKGTFNTNNRSTWMNVPIISWEEALLWPLKKNEYNLFSHEHWIITEKLVSSSTFALISKPFMEPRFRKNSILIIDPEAEYSDQKFIIISLDKKHVTIRQIIYDNSDIYLKHFDSTIPSIKFIQNDYLTLGIIIETRTNL